MTTHTVTAMYSTRQDAEKAAAAIRQDTAIGATNVRILPEHDAGTTTGTTHGACVISLPRSQVEMTEWDQEWQDKISKVVRRVAKDLIDYVRQWLKWKPKTDDNKSSFFIAPVFGSTPSTGIPFSTKCRRRYPSLLASSTTRLRGPRFSCFAIAAA